MKLRAFNAVCPYEVGDKVQIADSGEIVIITDICSSHYVVSGAIIFTYEFNKSGVYKQLGGLDKVKILSYNNVVVEETANTK